jgi:hypothetical protein
LSAGQLLGGSNLGGVCWTVVPARLQDSEPDTLRGISLDQSAAEQPVELFALAARKGRKRRFEDLAGDFVALAKRRLAERGEPMADRAGPATS